jgi:hypothetical protein
MKKIYDICTTCKCCRYLNGVIYCSQDNYDNMGKIYDIKTDLEDTDTPCDCLMKLEYMVLNQ